MVKKEIIEILKEYLNLLRTEGIFVHKAFLFGSHLTNTAIDESDIDFMIVTKNENNDYLSGKIWSLTKKVNTKIEPYVIDKNKFYTDDFSPLIQLVKSSGLEINIVS